MSLNAQLHAPGSNGRRAFALLAAAFVVVVLVVAGVATWQERTGRAALTVSLDTAVPGRSASTISVPEFVQRADAACGTAAARSDALRHPSGTVATVTAADLPSWSTYLRADIAIGVDLARSLRALPRPAASAAAFDEMLALVDKLIGALRSAQTAADHRDVTAFRHSLVLITSYGDAADDAALRAGLTVCGS
jgi:hypothetical protein